MYVALFVEVGPIKILGRESHSKNMTRIDYVVGRRAVAEMSRDGHVIAEVAALPNTSSDELGQIVQIMISDLQQAEMMVRRLGDRLVEYQAEELVEGGRTVGGVRLVVKVIGCVGPDLIRKTVARTISEQDSIVVALISGDGTLTITAGRSDDVDIHLTDPIVRIARERGGGVGGRVNLVSAGDLVASAEELRDRVAEALEQALKERWPQGMRIQASTCRSSC